MFHSFIFGVSGIPQVVERRNLPQVAKKTEVAIGVGIFQEHP